MTLIYKTINITVAISDDSNSEVDIGRKLDDTMLDSMEITAKTIDGEIISLEAEHWTTVETEVIE